MIGSNNHRRSRAIAWIAALLLVLQALSASLAIGTSAAAGPMLDAFGNPLCVTEHESPGQDRADHTGLPDCCTVSCGMFAAALDGTRHDVALDNPLRLAPRAERHVFRAVPDPNRAARRPGSPRSPPQTV